MDENIYWEEFLAIEEFSLMEQGQTGCSFVVWPNSVQALWANSWLSFDDNASWDKNKSFLQYTTRDHWIIFLSKNISENVFVINQHHHH